MSNDKILAIKSKTPYELEEFREKLKTSKTNSIQRLVDTYKKVITYTIVIYDGFDTHINDMLDKWIDYIKKFDFLAEYAMLSCCKNTLNHFYQLLHGKNNMSPDPIITLNVNLKHQMVRSETYLKFLNKTFLISPKLPGDFWTGNWGNHVLHSPHLHGYCQMYQSFPTTYGSLLAAQD